MNSEEIDALGNQTSRLSAFSGDLLEEGEDQVLQQIVREAAEDIAVPMALVNFVLGRIQFFKAHHGLPEDLAYTRGTDRNVSFCQFVVRDGVPFEVEDAEIDPRVPKHLVKHYSIRSYLGVPIKANDTTIGSLCVIDTKPRKFSSAEKSKLESLAKSVNKRLAILSEHRRKPDMARSRQNKSNALEELESSLYPIEEDILVGRSSHTAISAFLRLVEFNGSTPSSIEANHSVIIQTMKAAGEALVDASDRLFAIDVSLNRVKGLIDMLKSLVRYEARHPLPEIVSEGAALAKEILEAAGGVALVPSKGTHKVYVARSAAVLICAMAMSLIAGALLKAQSTKGLIVQTAGDASTKTVAITAALPADVLDDICRKLNTHTDGLNLNVTTGTKQLILQFSDEKQVPPKYTKA